MSFVDRADLDRLLMNWRSLMVPTCISKRARHPGCGLPVHCKPSKARHSFTAAETKQIAESIMQPAALDTFNEHHEVDFAYSLAGTGRFRRQCLLPTLLGGPGHAPRSWRHGHCGGFGAPRGSDPPRRGDAGSGPGHRPDRVREDDHAGGDGRPHQPHPFMSCGHHRGPGRVPPHGRHGSHRPT